MQNQELDRTLGVSSSTLLTLSAITPASSVFIIIPGVFAVSGTGAIWSLLIAAIVAFMMARVYGTLASCVPSAGGEYVIIDKVFGKGPSFMILAVNTLVMTLIPSVLASGAGQFFPYKTDVLTSSSIGAAIILFGTAIAVLKIRLNAWVAAIFLLIEILALAVIAYAGFSAQERPLAAVLFEGMRVEGSVVAPVMLSTVLASLPVALFAFNGYEQAIYLTEETKSASQKIMKIVTLSFLIGVILELMPSIGLLVGTKNLISTLSSTTPFADFIQNAVSSELFAWISFAIFLAILNACVVNILMTSRFIFSSGRDNFWGGRISRSLGTVNTGTRTPVIATLTVGLVSALACFLPLTFLLVATGTGLTLVYSAMCVTLIRGLQTGKLKQEGANKTFQLGIAAVVIAVLAYVIFQNAFDTTIGQPSLLLSVAVAAAGYLYYRLLGRKLIEAARP